MPIYSSDSDDVPTPSKRLFGREKPLHDILGGGKGHYSNFHFPTFFFFFAKSELIIIPLDQKI